MVSICCITYNHEKYIKKTLDGFLNQETDFKFEILIHDDCSSDSTTKIIREYEKKYPDLIFPIYQKENQYSKGIKITPSFQFPRAKGKYIAMCEGDDYWKDKKKLQKQFNVMEKNENCSICTHIVQYIDEENKIIDIVQPNNIVLKKIPHSGVIPSIKIFQEILKETIIPFQTSSYFFRTKYVKEYLTDLYKIVPLTEVGDVPLTWYMFYKGDCFFIKDSMSYYRYNCSGSWNARNKNVDKKINLYNELIAFFKIFDSYSKKINNNTIQYLVKKYNFIILQLEKNDF